jgi:hypothetical protein
MLKKIFLFAAIMAIAVPVAADPFLLVAPDTLGLDWPWHTSFPYQRNIHWDMLTDPFVAPPIYEGTDDGDLFVSDYIETSLGLIVYLGPGLGIGIDNTAGVDPVIDTLIIHIDNWDRDIPWEKHIWKEIQVELVGGAIIEEELWIDPAYRILKDEIYDPEHHYWWLKQNPEWEELVFIFNVPPGGLARITNLHIATECVKNCYGYYDSTTQTETDANGDPRIYRDFPASAYWGDAYPDGYFPGYEEFFPGEVKYGAPDGSGVNNPNGAYNQWVWNRGYEPPDSSWYDTFCVHMTNSSGLTWTYAGVGYLGWTLDQCDYIGNGGGIWAVEFTMQAPCDAVVGTMDTLIMEVFHCYYCGQGPYGVCTTECPDFNPADPPGFETKDTMVVLYVPPPPAMYIVQDSIFYIGQGQTQAFVPFGLCNADGCATLNVGWKIESKGHIAATPPDPYFDTGTEVVDPADCNFVYAILNAGTVPECTYDTLTIVAWDYTYPETTIYDTCVQIVHVVEPQPVPLFSAPVVTILVLAMILAAAVFMRRRAVSRA